MRCTGRWLVGGLFVAIACLFLFSGSPPAAGQAPPATELDEQLARQQQVVERFLTVLERNPRRGTALDKIYGFHIENGTIEAFVEQIRQRTAAKPDDGVGWMILGLVESQRGRDAAAVTALTKAKELRSADPLAAYYLGQSLVLIGQPEQAAAAFEEAISRRPAPADLLEVFQALGRVHQRAQRSEEALAVWNRLEKLFPNDARVQEQIALTLVEEGQHAEALPRYEALAKSTTDDYRRTVYHIEAAELKVKLNRVREGIAGLEALIARLNPDSWLFREVRRKIEEVFLKTEDQDGLTNYYTAWLEKNREDVDAMARLARVLARQGRVPEAQQWLDKALKLAPSRKELRLAFIEQLVDDQRYPDAIQQYVALDQADPNNADYLRDWGKLLLRDLSRPKEERQAEAEKVWQRLVAARPSDPLVAAQVADLYRQGEMPDQALALYRKAVELAPRDGQYREYLGEYYHILKRPAEALATWRKIIEGDQRTAANLARLAEVFAQFGYLAEALPEIAAACELDPKDFSLQLKAADLHIRSEQYDVALASLARSEKLAQNDEEREAVLSQQIKTYTHQDKLAEMARQLDQLATAGSATAEQWYLLARYREALREYPEATKAINEAIAREPTSIPSLASAARIAEQAGDLATSADLNRKLATLDRRGRSGYLERVAQLQTQLGRTEEALAAGRDLIAAAPGNVETYQFFADLCFRLGRHDDGIAALRRATRVNPNESKLLLALAAALAGQFRTDEAIELYWQTFEKGATLDDKLTVIGRLAELHLQTNHFDRLLERLERGRREADQRREMTICLAQAYQSAGDYGMARQELERLLSENTRDTQLLAQLSKLAESESDLITAVKFQEQLARLAPGDETEFRLATLLSRSGSTEEAAAILVRLALKEEDKEKLLRNLDSLLANGEEETALAVLEPKRREDATDWELLYREGVALAQRSPAEATLRFQAILDQTLSDDEFGTAAKARQAAQQQMTTPTPGAASSTSAMASANTRFGPFNRLTYSYEVRSAIGIDPDRYGYTQMRTIWTPQTFGNARMAALGWLYRFAMDGGQIDAFVAARKERAERPEASGRDLWDWMYLQTMRNETADMLETAKRLAQQNDLAGQYQYLAQLYNRNPNQYQPATSSTRQDATPPLPADEMELALRSFRAVRLALGDPRQIVQFTQSALLRLVLIELARSGRRDEEQRLYQDALAKTDTPAQLAEAIQIAAQRNDVPMTLSLFERFAAKDLLANDARSNPARQARTNVINTLGMMAGNTAAQPADTLNVLDRFLDYHVAWTSQQRNNPLNRPTGRIGTGPSSTYAYVFVGGTRRRVGMTFPAPNAYFDTNAITLVRTVFEQFKQKDLVSDLLKHCEARATAAAAGDKIYALLALAYVQVWSEDQDASFNTLNAAAELAPQDAELRMDIARLHMQVSQLDEALAMVDAVTPLDQRVLQARETLALDLAVRLGDQQRARQAAERMFGLRLDPETQVQLAGQMRRLGMAEEAEAVIARAQRQAGNRVSALAALMAQYQSQGKMEIAVQVAHQILRRSRTQSVSQRMMGVYTADSQYRNSALECLAQAGKLKELIGGIETQLARSPSAMQLYETLAEYYQSAGDAQKMLDLQAKIVELRPDDQDLRYRYAHALYEQGKYSEACDNYVTVLKKQPRLMGDNYWQVQESFRAANRQLDLLKVLGEIDIRSLGQPYVVVNLINNMSHEEESRTAAMSLLKRAWEALPAYRSNLMRSFGTTDVWSSPEVFEYARQSIAPSADFVRQNPWYGIGDIISYSQEGRVQTVLGNVLEAGLKNNQLPAVRETVAKAIGELPQWRGGPAVLALIDLKLGKQIDPQASFAALLAPGANDYRLQYARWVAGQELGQRPEFQSIAEELLKLSVEDNMQNRQFQYSAAHTLVRQYVTAGRTEDARKLLTQQTNAKPLDSYSDPFYSLGRRVEDLAAIGRVAEELEFPIEALRVYREILTNPSYSDPQIANYFGRNVAHYRQQAQRGIDSITDKLADDPSGQIALALLAPLAEPPEGSPAIDLMLVAQDTDSPLPKLDSTLDKLIKPQSLSATAAAALDAQLAALAEKHPRDASVRIVQTLAAQRRGDAASASSAVEALRQFIAQTPLETLGVGQRPNSRQRAEAAQQVGLWLVARHCAKRPEIRGAYEALTDRAVDAARRQVEPTFLSAILSEKGLLALEAGDRAAAEHDWSALIDFALVQPRLPRPKTALAASQSTGARATAAARPAGPIPATLSQFTLAAGLARVAAEHRMTAVSLQAIRDALSGGLPVPDLPKTPLGGAAPRMQSAGIGRGDLDNTVSAEVASRMWELSLVWRQHSFPPAEVCQLLESLVFPPQREGDILLYEQPLGEDWTSPRSVGRLLVEWAVRADRLPEVKSQIAARKGTPNDSLAGEVLLVQLNVALGDRDEARKHLAAIGTLLEGAKIAALTSAASHAAALAFADPQLARDVAPLLDKISQAALPQTFHTSGSGDPLIRLLTRHHIKEREFAAAKGLVERYLTRQQPMYGQYGGDYGLNIQKQDLAWAASELSRGGELDATLQMLARFADAPKYPHGDPSITLAALNLARQARRLAPAERYAALRDWTLPTKDRRSVRVVAGFDPGQPVPTIFLTADDPPYQPTPSLTPVSNLSLLVDAATEAGTLKELAQLLEPLAAEKIPSTDALLTLVLLAQKDEVTAQRLTALADATRERLDIKPPETTPGTPIRQRSAGQQIPRVEWGDVLVVQAALADKRFAAAAVKPAELLMEHARRTGQTDLVAHLAGELVQHTLRSVPPDQRQFVTQPPLAHWFAAPAGTASPSIVWSVHEGHLVHRTGDSPGQLYFRYPLEGEFEFSFDAPADSSGHFAAGYAGLVCAPSAEGGTSISPVSQHEHLSRATQRLNSDGFSRITVRVSPSGVRFFVNGHFAYEDSDYSRTSPWLHLQAHAENQRALKNLRLAGQPSIPRELRLIERDRLEGWIASAGLLPKRLTAKEPPDSDEASVQYDQFGQPIRQVPPKTDWSAEGGVLKGRIDPTAAPQSESLLSYHRPLLAGDKVRYQFLYKPGLVHVHPALGRIAFLLEPEGVHLHWITIEADSEGLQIDPSNRIDEVASRRGPTTLPLKVDDWNEVQLAIAGSNVTVELNGVLVCERPIEPTSDQRFGLFRYLSQSAAEVREIVLTGDWPRSLSDRDLADLLALSPHEATPAVLRARYAIAGESVLATGAYTIWTQAMSLAPAERYEFLKDWVMPGREHPKLRMAIDWTPTDPAPHIAHQFYREADSFRSSRGGELVSPARELVTVAKELGKLDELATAAALAAKELPDQLRNITAFELLLAVARGDEATAAARLAQSLEFVKKQPADTPLHERHAEFLAAYAALAQPASRSLARTLAQAIVADQRPPRDVNAVWSRRTPRLRALATWAVDPATGDLTFGATPALAQWQPITRAAAKDRGAGIPAAAWKLSPGEAAYRTGTGRDALYHFLPLTGDFEVRGQITTAANRGIRLMYGGVSIGLNPEGTGTIRHEVGRSATNRMPLAEKIANWAPTVECRLVINQGTMTAHVNGQQVHSERLPTHFDPWLAIETNSGNQTGMVKGLQILGTPTVPREISLSKGSSLEGWLADYYGEADSGQEPVWTKRGEEITAPKLENAAGGFRESVLQYHRPLLEDGELEYEFYHQPGKTEVHPAVDRLAFLLAPDGVKIHWLTDDQYDRTGLSPDNATPIPDSSPVPLKPGEWNMLRLVLTGNDVTISVNGTQVAKQSLHPTNQRTFGLFRYADVSGVRVRNVVHRGKWPEKLPPLAEQKLAAAK